MSWSQYPLNGSLEGAYCSEYFGEIPESSTRNSRESFLQSPEEWFVNTSATSGSTRVATGNAAMALGAGRAAGLIPQLGAVQAFNRVRTSSLASPKLSVGLDPSTSKNTEVQPKSTSPEKFFSKNVNDLEMPTTMLLKPQQFGSVFRFPGLPPSLPPSNVTNHSIIPQIDPHSVGFINANPSKDLELQVSYGNIERDGLAGPCDLNAHAVARTEEEPEFVSMSYTNSRTPPSMLSRNISSVRKQNSCAACVADKQKFEPSCSYTSWSHASCDTKSAEAGSRERQQFGSYIFHTSELTETSSDQKTDNIFVQGARMERATIPMKRDARELEGSADFTSEAQQNEFIEQNKIESGRIRVKTSKRSRTAEVHNLSERRRRDRINEKMRALQDLIPNSNKTDKASMLEEAIEYLKMLQLQLQLMSLRTGMRLPPTLIPARTHMQHLHPLQIPQLQPMGLEMAHGIIDNMQAAATSLWPYNNIPYPSFPAGAAHCLSIPISEASTDLDVFNQPSLVDSNSSCSTHQHLHLPSQPSSMEADINACPMHPQHYVQSQYCGLHLSPQQSIQTTTRQHKQLSFQHLQQINQE